MRRPPMTIPAAVLIAATIAAAAGAGPAVARPAPPNVLLIGIDTMRGDHLACAGNDWIATPHLDALAADGVLFTRCFATAPAFAAQSTSAIKLLLRSANTFSSSVGCLSATDSDCTPRALRPKPLKVCISGFALAALRGASPAPVFPVPDVLVDISNGFRDDEPLVQAPPLKPNFFFSSSFFFFCETSMLGLAVALH